MGRTQISSICQYNIKLFLKRSEIIINVPVALTIMNSGFLWPVEAWKEFSSGDLLAAEDDVTKSPR